MSRTYRRKKVTNDQILETYCYRIEQCVNDRCFGIHCSRNCSIRDDKYTVSKYHRETKSGYGWDGHAPKSYTRMLNRERRAKDKVETSRVLRHMDYDGYSFDKWIKDAGWFYW
jgi:hypothetical protein